MLVAFVVYTVYRRSWVDGRSSKKKYKYMVKNTLRGYLIVAVACYKMHYYLVGSNLSTVSLPDFERKMGEETWSLKHILPQSSLKR